MKYRPKIGAGDFDTKTKKVEQFLAEGHKVKVTIMFRGREMQHPELGRKILDQVAEAVVDVGRVEIYPRLDGRNMTMVLGPGQEGPGRSREAAPGRGRSRRAGDAPDRHRRRLPPASTTGHPPTGRGRRAADPEPTRHPPGPRPAPASENPMPKMKTHQGAKKRFKITGTGKITRRKANLTTSSRRSPRPASGASGRLRARPGDAARVRRQLGI